MQNILMITVYTVITDTVIIVYTVIAQELKVSKLRMYSIIAYMYSIIAYVLYYCVCTLLLRMYSIIAYVLYYSPNTCLSCCLL